MNRVDVLIKKTYYIYKRFNVQATFAMLYHEKPLSVVELSEFIRVSDQLIELDENHYFIIFAFTSAENAYKASQNIVHKLDNHLNSTNSCIALDAFDVAKTPQNVFNRLKQILSETRKHSYARIEMEDILDRK
ncbi:MAG: hypothetical protein C0627_09860 [Sulfurimonas sp.]|nr:MAG: hypothetical protein C0627_09860 [Sulfurimonas sp.]